MSDDNEREFMLASIWNKSVANSLSEAHFPAASLIPPNWGAAGGWNTKEYQAPIKIVPQCHNRYICKLLHSTQDTSTKWFKKCFCSVIAYRLNVHPLTSSNTILYSSNLSQQCDMNGLAGVIRAVWRSAIICREAAGLWRKQLDLFDKLQKRNYFEIGCNSNLYKRNHKMLIQFRSPHN